MFSRLLERFRQLLQGESPIWLTVYSDLMTNLMLFFLMMYGVTRMAPEVRAQIFEGLQNRFQQEGKTIVEQKAADVFKKIQEEASST